MIAVGDEVFKEGVLRFLADVALRFQFRARNA